MNFALHPSLDADALASVYARDGLVRIAPFLAEGGAEALLAHLAARDDWMLSLKSKGARIYKLDRRAVDGLSPAQVQALRHSAAPVAPRGFRYHYDAIKAVDDANLRLEEDTLLAELAAFLSSDPVRAFLGRVLGAPTIGFADAFASRYGPGDFLTIHQDAQEDRIRLAAYVLGLSPEWRPEWGGLLLFHDDDGTVTQGLVPAFNTLTLFAVPRDHSVSQVASFAPRPRYAVTGWLRPPPA